MSRDRRGTSTRLREFSAQIGNAQRRKTEGWKMNRVEANKRNRLAKLSRGFAKKSEQGFSWRETVTHFLPEPWPAARRSMRVSGRVVPLRLDHTEQLVRAAG